jgi:CysZ protein
MPDMLGIFGCGGKTLMHYLMKGLSLIRVKGLKRYVVVPLSINLLLFAMAFGYLFSQLGRWVDQVVATL